MIFFLFCSDGVDSKLSIIPGYALLVFLRDSVGGLLHLVAGVVSEWRDRGLVRLVRNELGLLVLRERAFGRPGIHRLGRRELNERNQEHGNEDCLCPQVIIFSVVKT